MPGIDVFAHELAEVSRDLRQAGDKDLLKELSDAIKNAVDPLPRTIHDQLPERLPNRYARVLDADLVIRVTRRTRAGSTRISVVAPERGVRSVERRRLIRLDQGILEHPLFRNRRHWYKQPVTAGFFTQPAEDLGPHIRQDIEDALDRVKEQIFKGAHQ